MGRIGEPQEIADIALWLMSPASSLVTGARISMPGEGASMSQALFRQRNSWKGAHHMLLAKEDRSMVPSAFDDISYNLCKRRDDVLMMSADLAHYVDLYKVTKDLPDQYVEVGMAEQNLVGVAAGLAKAGFTPVTTTFGSYASRRCFDQMVICMGTSKNTGICIGFTPGLQARPPFITRALKTLACCGRCRMRR